jgi:exosortase
MIYSMKGELRKLPLSTANWGLFFLLAGLGQLYVASVGSEFFLQRTSLIPVLLGMSLFLWGTSITRKLLLPIFYLLFMVPLPAIIWNKIAFPMQLFSSAITEEVVRLIGIPIFREGNVLHLAQTTLEVVDACSGLRSLTTMFALAAALAWFSDLSRWKKWALFLLAAPVAMFANIVRLTATAALASMYGEKVAQGFLHDFSGLFTFLFGLLLLILLNKLLHGKQ